MRFPTKPVRTIWMLLSACLPGAAFASLALSGLGLAGIALTGLGQPVQAQVPDNPTVFQAPMVERYGKPYVMVTINGKGPVPLCH